MRPHAWRKTEAAIDRTLMIMENSRKRTDKKKNIIDQLNTLNSQFNVLLDSARYLRLLEVQSLSQISGMRIGMKRPDNPISSRAQFLDSAHFFLFSYAIAEWIVQIRDGLRFYWRIAEE